ncbi:MAG: hypothetical protein ACO3RV_01850 [Luteolibacter sp.]
MVPDGKLRSWVDAWHRGSITAEEGLKLEQRLMADPAAMEYLFEMAALEAALPTATLHVSGRDARQSSSSNRPSWYRLRGWHAAAVLLAAVLPAVWWLTAALGPAPTESQRVPDAPHAVVSGQQGLVWGAASPDSTSSFGTGRTRHIESGLLELQWRNGARVLLEGPARFAVTGPLGMRLDFGRLVAKVPPAASGFTIDSREGQIIDIGTEFAVDIADEPAPAEMAVFHGEIRVIPDDPSAAEIELHAGHALALHRGVARSIPFEPQSYTRELPSRELTWEFDAHDPHSSAWGYDVGHLIRKPGRYRLIAKQLNGSRIVRISSVSLGLKGTAPLAEDIHESILPLGRILGIQNDYVLDIPPAQFEPGAWILRIAARIDAEGLPGSEPYARGVFLLEEADYPPVDAEKFLGTWDYHHDGMHFRRSFLPDGSATLSIDGVDYPGFEGSRWHVENGFLYLSLRDDSGHWFEETHGLRNSDTLIFINRPYRNAKRFELPSHAMNQRE